MKDCDLSDRKLKLGVALAMAIIAWLCLKGASASHTQTTPANLSPGAQEVVITAENGATTRAGSDAASVTGL
jgi:hypothetical protein